MRLTEICRKALVPVAIGLTLTGAVMAQDIKPKDELTNLQKIILVGGMAVYTSLMTYSSFYAKRESEQRQRNYAPENIENYQNHSE